MAQSAELPVYFVSHGGGPWPWMPEWSSMYTKLEASLKDIPKQLPQKPSAILCITAHWESDVFTISSNPNPGMLYDYGGFPAHTFKVKYSAPGSPDVAKRVKQLVESAGFKAKLDDKRGYDHGTFVPLYVIYPDADIPVVQMSINSNYDPETHIKLGQALAPLRNENVLIVGSGLSVHNLPLFFDSRRAHEIKHGSKEFDDWLQETMTAEPEERKKRLLTWSKAPSARVSHPPGGEDHLVPLFVAVGAAGNDASKCVYYENTFMGHSTASSHRFG